NTGTSRAARNGTSGKRHWHSFWHVSIKQFSSYGALMNAPSPTPTSLRSLVSGEEWEMRCNLAALYRLVALFGWDDLIFTHITAKVPGTEDHFLINPYGFMFEEITASSLVKVDLQGRKVMGSEYDINPAGFIIHSCIHAARKDAT